MEDIKVSVSSRSYILSYSVSRHTLETCRYVSVSSRSYILSYYDSIIYHGTRYTTRVSVSSRSYILSYCTIDLSDDMDIEFTVSVSSRSYILSYAKSIEKMRIVPQVRAFPSPLGVIFSLIFIFNKELPKWLSKSVSVSSRSYILSYNAYCSTQARINRLFSFRLLSELYSLLLIKQN